MRIKSLTLDKFNETITKKTKRPFRAKQVEMLRAVFVDGEMPATVARQFGITKQSLDQTMKLFHEIYINHSDIDSSMVSVTLELPEILAVDLNQFLNVLHACNDEKKSKEAMDNALAGIHKATALLSS